MFILERSAQAILDADRDDLEKAVVDNFDFDPVAQDLQR